MKNSNTAFGALALLVVVGCGGGTKPKQDLGAPDLAGSADMSGSVTCTTVATWPNNDTTVVGQANPFSGIDFVTGAYEHRPNATTPAFFDEMRAEVWDSASAPTSYPTTFTFKSTDTYNGCTGCMGILIGADPNDQMDTPGTFYFAQSGTMTVTKADRDPTSGSFAATASNVHLVEWSYFDAAGTDTAIAGGGCYDVTNFSASGTYANSLDGGTD
jgi:hypothetical protein